MIGHMLRKEIADARHQLSQCDDIALNLPLGTAIIELQRAREFAQAERDEALAQVAVLVKAAIYRTKWRRGDLLKCHFCIALWQDDPPWPLDKHNDACPLSNLPADAKEMVEETKMTEALVQRQAGLLTGVVNAIRGEPDELYLHSHHDAPELVREVVEKARKWDELKSKARNLVDRHKPLTGGVLRTP